MWNIIKFVGVLLVGAIGYLMVVGPPGPNPDSVQIETETDQRGEKIFYIQNVTKDRLVINNILVNDKECNWFDNAVSDITFPITIEFSEQLTARTMPYQVANVIDKNNTIKIPAGTLDAWNKNPCNTKTHPLVDIELVTNRGRLHYGPTQRN